MKAMNTWRWALVGVVLALQAAASSRTYGVHSAILPLEFTPGPLTQSLREAAKRSKAEDYAGAARMVAAIPLPENEGARAAIDHVLKQATDLYAERARLASQSPASAESLSALLGSLLRTIAPPEWHMDQVTRLDARSLRLFSELRTQDAATREAFERPLRVGFRFEADVDHEDGRAYTSTLLRELRKLGFTPEVVDEGAELLLEVRSYSLGWAMNSMPTPMEEAMMQSLGVRVRWERGGKAVVAPYDPHRVRPFEFPCNGGLQLDAVCLAHVTARTLVRAWVERASTQP